MKHRQRRRILSAVGLLGATAGALALATGKIAFVATRGVSMLPRFHTGDLAILVAASSYHVGEVVAYRSPLLHTTVMHRIVAESGGLFTFKGDHNTWLDAQRLPASAITGTLWLHIPKVGRYLTWAMQPLHLAVLGAVGAALISVLGFSRHRRAEDAAPPRHTGSLRHVNAGALALIGATLAAASIGIGVIGLRTPSTRTVGVTVPYSGHLQFSYSGTAKRGTVYPDGRITTGDPVFVGLLRSLVVGVNFRLRSSGATYANGTIALDAQVDSGDGWSRTINSSVPTRFFGTAGSAQLALPIAAALKVATSAARESGAGEEGMTVAVSAEVVLNGTVAGQQLAYDITEPLIFQLSPVELSLLPSSGSVRFPQLVATHNGSVQRQESVPAEITFRGRSITAHNARFLGALGAAIGLVLLGVGLVLHRRRRGLSEDEKAVQRVERELVPVQSDPASAVGSVVDIATMTALVDLAERFEVALLDYAHGDGHTYFARVGDLLYRYGGAVAPVDSGEAEEVAAGEQGVIPVLAEDEAPATARDPAEIVEVAVGLDTGIAEPTNAAEEVPEAEEPDVASAESPIEEPPQSDPVEEVAPDEQPPEAIVIRLPIERKNQKVLSASADEADVIPIRAEPTTTEEATPGAGAAEVVDAVEEVDAADAEHHEDLGLNAWFAEQMHEKFLEDADSVPESWRDYFSQAREALG